MDWETARRWLEIMAKNVFDPNQPAYIVVLQRVEELEAALKLGAEAYVAALPDASTDAMTDLTIERNALRHENERLREWIVSAGELCNCGAFDFEVLVTRGECSDCRYAALRGGGE